MSHTVRSTVKMANDLEIIRAMIEPLGGVLHEGQTVFRSYFGMQLHTGETGVDTSCVHAISFPGITYQVGLKLNDDGSLSPAFDYYGYEGGGHDGYKLAQLLGGNDAPRLGQEYRLSVMIREMARKGFRATRGVDVEHNKIQAICWR